MNINNYDGTSVNRAAIYTDLHGVQSLRQMDDKQEVLSEVARQFESMFVNMMLKSMREANAVFEENSLFNNRESQFYRDMHDKQLALSLVHGRGLGFADALYRQLDTAYGSKLENIEKEKNTDRVDKLSMDNHSAKKNLLFREDIQANLAQRSVSNQSLPDFQRDIFFGETNSIQPAAINTQVTVSNQKSSNSSENNLGGRKAIVNSAIEFVEKLKPYAQFAAKQLKVNPLVLIAQSALETGWGQHVIADNHGNSTFNLFNIKAHRDWDKETVNVQTLEYSNENPKKEIALFRKYHSIQESFIDYVNFLKMNPRYEHALAKSGEATEFVSELQQAGYATDPNYAKKIQRVLTQIHAMGTRSGVER